MVKNIYISEATVLAFSAESEAAMAKFCPQYMIEPALIKAFMKQESMGYTMAVRNDIGVLTRPNADGSPSWAVVCAKKHGLPTDDYKVFSSWGLLQILYIVAYENGFRGSAYELCSPTVQIELGCKLLRKSMDAWDKIRPNNFKDVISAWNGWGYVDLNKNGKRDPNEPFKNQEYVDNVYNEYKKQGGTK